MLRRTLGIRSEHSDFDCTDGDWAFHLGIQILNAQLDIGHSTGALLLEHRTFYRSIQLSKAQIGIGHSNWAFRF